MSTIALDFIVYMLDFTLINLGNETTFGHNVTHFPLVRTRHLLRISFTRFKTLSLNTSLGLLLNKLVVLSLLIIKSYFIIGAFSTSEMSLGYINPPFEDSEV